MILTVTPNPAVDHTIHFDEPLQTGVVHRTDDAVFTAGGKGINVAKYASALDADVTASGFLGGHSGSSSATDSTPTASPRTSSPSTRTRG